MTEGRPVAGGRAWPVRAWIWLTRPFTAVLVTGVADPPPPRPPAWRTPIQAEAAPIKAPDDPEMLKTELAGIRVTALQALAELRRTLGVLRNGDQAMETTPQPDLSGIEQLLASSRAAGLAVTLAVAGRPPVAPGGVGLAAYRVIQESLSNALRHAPGAAVRVSLAYHDSRLDLRVENDPPPDGRPVPARRPAGHRWSICRTPPTRWCSGARSCSTASRTGCRGGGARTSPVT